jgi:hypothetical protein
MRTARASNFGEEVKSQRSKSVKGKGKKVTSSRAGDDDDDDAKS